RRLHETRRRDGDVRQSRGLDQNVIYIKLRCPARAAGDDSSVACSSASQGDLIIPVLPHGWLGLAAIRQPDFPEYVVHTTLRRRIRLVTQPQPIPDVVLPCELVLRSPRPQVIQELDVTAEVFVPKMQIHASRR